MFYPIIRLAVFTSLVAFSQVTSAAETGVRWSPLCEPGGGGALVALQVSPDNPKHLIASGDMLGAAVSVNGGDSWQPAFGFPSYEMCDITFHPTETNTVWMGTCMGAFKSTDGGFHWVSKRNGMPASQPGRYTVIVEKVLFDPARPTRLLAFGGSSRRWNEADSFGWIWESTDNGETWRHLATLAKEGFSTEAKKGVNIWFAAFAPGSSNTLHVLADAIGWWTSTDGGATWQARRAEGVDSEITGLTFHPRNPGILWATTHNHATGDTQSARKPGGVFKSSDGGKTFTPCDRGIPKACANSTDDNQTSWFNGVALSPANPDVLYVSDQAWSGATVYKSADAGVTWQAVLSRKPTGSGNAAFCAETACWAGTTLKLRADPSSADRIYGFNTEFILRTADGGKTWDDATAYRPDPALKDHWRGRGWNGWCSVNFAWNPFRKGQSIAQTMDAGRGWISDDNLHSWHYAMGQTHPWLGGQDVSFSSDGSIFITTGQFGEGNGIQRSTDWGQTWTTLAGAARSLPEAGWGNKQEYAGVFVHPQDSKRVWAVLQGSVLHSADRGETWQRLSGVRDANYLAGDPTRPGRFYVKTATGIFVTGDGASFTNIGLPQLSRRSRITCDAQGRVLACQWREGRTGVWRYTPSSKTWQRLLDEEQALACCADPSAPNRLLLVTSMDPFHDRAGGNGVWLSCDDGKSWSPANDNLPMLRANACAFNPFDPEEIVVGTYGMGFFRARWPKDFKPAGTRSYTSEAADTRTTSGSN